MEKFTVFIQADDRTGTMWIGSVDAEDIGVAKIKAYEACASDWGCDADDIIVVGVASGDVEILEWDDE